MDEWAKKTRLSVIHTRGLVVYHMHSITFFPVEAGDAEWKTVLLQLEAAGKELDRMRTEVMQLIAGTPNVAVVDR